MYSYLFSNYDYPEDQWREINSNHDHVHRKTADINTCVHTYVGNINMTNVIPLISHEAWIFTVDPCIQVSAVSWKVSSFYYFIAKAH